MMVNLMRTNQRWLMMIISALVIISLFWFYTERTNIDRNPNDRVGTIYGRPVSASEFDRVRRRLEVSRALGTNEVSRAASEDGYDQDDAQINYYVLEHEAEALGIKSPTPDEIRAAGEKLPRFLGPNGEYDPTRQALFIDSVINPAGLGANQIDELVRMNIMTAKLRAIVTAGVVVSPVEARTRYEEAYARTDASVIRLKAADVAAAPEPTDDEIKKYYDGQKDLFKQPERRRVQYVKFVLDDAQTKIQGKMRMDALKPLADHAALFLEKLLDQKGKADFAAIAAAEGLPAKETADFEEGQNGGLEEADIPQFTLSAFKLTKEEPDSDVPLETPTGFYDLHLTGVTPERPLTLDEARPKIVTAIKAERAKVAVAAKAEEVRAKIAEALKAGRSFAEAAKDAGQTAEELPPFSMMEPDVKFPDAEEIIGVAQTLAIGELGKFVPKVDGGMFVFVRARYGADDAKYEAAKGVFTTQMQTQKGRVYFYEWMRAARESAGAKFLGRNRG